MAKHIATGLPTQVAHPVKASLRTAVAYLLAAITFLAAAIPIIQEVAGDYLPESWVAWLTGAVAFLAALATLITRLMALAKAQDFLAKIGLGTGVEKETAPVETSGVITIPRAQLEGWYNTPPLTGSDWRAFAETLPPSEAATALLSVADAMDRGAPASYPVAEAHGATVADPERYRGE